MFCKRQLTRAIIGNQQEGQWQLTIGRWQSTRAMSRRISCCEVLSKVLRQRRPVTEIVFDLVASFEQVFSNTIVIFEIIAFHKNFSVTFYGRLQMHFSVLCKNQISHFHFFISVLCKNHFHFSTSFETVWIECLSRELSSAPSWISFAQCYINWQKHCL